MRPYAVRVPLKIVGDRFTEGCCGKRSFDFAQDDEKTDDGKRMTKGLGELVAEGASRLLGVLLLQEGFDLLQRRHAAWTDFTQA
jgi:hypothetical protein